MRRHRMGFICKSAWYAASLRLLCASNSACDGMTVAMVGREEEGAKRGVAKSRDEC